ncbi:recombinase family protein [Pseudomonadota bacterium]
MKKAVIYTRVSDPDQLAGLSLDVQKELCAKWAKKNGHQVTGIYEDGGKTGTKTVGRHGLEDMIIRCQEGGIDVALVIDTDRIARNEFDHYYIRRELKKAGTKLIAVNQPMIDGSPEGQLMDGVLANINAFYSRLTGRKVKKSLEKKLNDGHWPGWAPIGYINVNKGSEEKPHRIVEKYPEKHSLIAELFRHYATGNYSVDILVDMMYDAGLRSQNNKKVSRSVMYNILKNPFYISLMRYKGNIYKGEHLSITTPEIFETCQKITQRNNHNACRRRKYKWLLSGFVYCQECQTRLYSSWNHKKEKAYYHGHVRNGCNHYFSLGDLEETVAQELTKIQFSEEFTQRIINKAKELVKQSRESRDTEIQALRNSIKKIEDKRNVLEDNLLDKTIDKESFKRKHNELNIRIQNLKNEIATIENQRGFDVDVVTEILNLTNNIYQTYSDAKFEAKRHYLSIFFERFDIKDGKVAKVTYTPLFHKLVTAEKVSVTPNWLPGVDSNHGP